MVMAPPKQVNSQTWNMHHNILGASEGAIRVLDEFENNGKYNLPLIKEAQEEVRKFASSINRDSLMDPAYTLMLIEYHKYYNTLVEAEAQIGETLYVLEELAKSEKPLDSSIGVARNFFEYLIEKTEGIRYSQIAPEY